MYIQPTSLTSSAAVAFCPWRLRKRVRSTHGAFRSRIHIAPEFVDVSTSRTLVDCILARDRSENWGRWCDSKDLARWGHNERVAKNTARAVSLATGKNQALGCSYTSQNLDPLNVLCA